MNWTKFILCCVSNVAISILIIFFSQFLMDLVGDFEMRPYLFGLVFVLTVIEIVTSYFTIKSEEKDKHRDIIAEINVINAIIDGDKDYLIKYRNSISKKI